MRGEGDAARFFPADFRALSSFKAKAAEIDARITGDRRLAWTDAVTAPSEKARARLAAVRDGSGYVVTTGQQPGLFGGPLYSLYKPITAAVLADRLEAELGKPVAPLFWTASEDHDWAEANHTFVVGVDNELHKLQLPSVEGAGDRPLYRIPMGAGVEACLAQFEELIPTTDFSAPYLTVLRESFTPEATLPEAFEAVLAKLLEPMGMLFVQAHAPALKRLSMDVMHAELVGSVASERALAARAGEIEAAGYDVQAPILEGGVNLFLDCGGERERLYRDGDGFVQHHSGTRWSTDDIVKRAADEPCVLSPNVLLRPVVESAVFPTLAYVAGPGEQAYFAQLEPLFQVHGVGMPVVFPRLGATVVETKVGKVLDKFGLDEGDLARPLHELAGERAREEVPAEVKKALGEFKGLVARGVQSLTEATRVVDPTLKGPVQHVRSVALDALGDVEKKILQAVKRENEVAMQQIEKAHLHLYPDTSPQERVFNPFYYLSRYGDAFVDEVASSFASALPPLDREG